jgi:hypothetical protein
MKFYLLRKNRTHGKVPFSTTDEYMGCKLVNCSVCGTRGMIGKNQLGKVPVELLVKDVVDKLDDIEQASTVLLASRKFRDTVADAGLTGIEFYPVVGYQSKGKNKLFQEMVRRCRDEADYQVIHITGSGGSIAQSSRVELTMSCDACGWVEWSLPRNGFHIDEAQWDGSDFFNVKEFAPFFMSEKAVEVLSNAGLSNFGALLATEYRVPSAWFNSQKVD